MKCHGKMATPNATEVRGTEMVMMMVILLTSREGHLESEDEELDFEGPELEA